MKFSIGGCIFFSSLVFAACNSLVPKTGPISNQQLESDLVNQRVSIPSIVGWKFEKEEMRCVKITRTDAGSDRAIVVADIVTAGNYAGPFVVVGISGQVEAFYSKIGDRWVLDKVENKALEVDYSIESGKRSGKGEEEVQSKTRAICQNGYDNRMGSHK